LKKNKPVRVGSREYANLAFDVLFRFLCTSVSFQLSQFVIADSVESLTFRPETFSKSLNLIVKMSAYDSVVVGRLKLKGKALDVKAGGIKKKKKRDKRYHHLSESNSGEHSTLFSFKVM
jgi:hypothetical protein